MRNEDVPDPEIIDGHFNGYVGQFDLRIYPWFHKILSAPKRASIDGWSAYCEPVEIRRGIMPSAIGLFVGLIRRFVGTHYRSDPRYWQIRSLRELTSRLAQNDDRILSVVALAYLQQGEAIKPFLHDLARFPKVTAVRWILQFEPDPSVWEDPKLLEGIRSSIEAGYRVDLPINVHHGDRIVAALSKLPADKITLHTMGYLKLEEWRDWRTFVERLARTGVAYKMTPHFTAFMPKPACILRANIGLRLGFPTPNRHVWRADDYVGFAKLLIDSFGPDRTMFCTDWPNSAPFIGLTELIDLTHESMRHLSAVEARGVWGQNAVDLYSPRTFPR